MEVFDLAANLTNGIENIVKGILRATQKDPHESAFMNIEQSEEEA